MSELSKETQRLHNLIEKKNKVALKAVEKLLEHPCSLERMRAQVAEMNRQAGLDKNNS